MMMEAKYNLLTTKPALKTYISQNVHNLHTLLDECHQFKEKSVYI
jgi:hypothetical protein